MVRKRFRLTTEKTFALDAMTGKRGSGVYVNLGLSAMNRRRTQLLGVEEDVSKREENTSSNTRPELAERSVGPVSLDISEGDRSFV